MSDPFKEMVRMYDAAVVARGGSSIFDLRRPVFVRPQGTGVPDSTPRPRLPALSSDDLRHYLKTRRAVGAVKARKQVLPGRILGGATGKLGGFASDWED